MEVEEDKEKPKDHECKQNDLVWEDKYESDGDCLTKAGKCKICGKEYEETWTLTSECEGGALWSRELDDYVTLDTIGIV